MLALTVSFLAAVYIFGPDLVNRFILGFVVPSRKIQQTRGEEIVRALLTAIWPLAGACVWIKIRHVFDWASLKPQLQIFFADIISDKLFEEEPSQFFSAAKIAWGANWSLAWRLYTLLIIYAVLLDVLIYHYGRIRNSGRIAKSPLLRKVLAIFILPRVSEWHVLLTGFQHKKSVKIRADILTKSGILYRGNVEEPFLSPSGSFTGLLISNPVRFKREEYLDDKKGGKNPDKDKYWKQIPSQTFLIMADDIGTINLRHVSPSGDEQLLKELQRLLSQKLTTALKDVETKRQPPQSS